MSLKRLFSDMLEARWSLSFVQYAKNPTWPRKAIAPVARVIRWKEKRKATAAWDVS